MSRVDDLVRSVRKDAAANQRIMAIASRIFGAMDAQEMGESAASSRELAAKMIAGLGIVPAPGDDIAMQLLDAFAFGWNAAVANQGRPLPPGIRAGSRAGQALDGASIVGKYLRE